LGIGPITTKASFGARLGQLPIGRTPEQVF
jgi:hypothetical protein